MLIIEALLEIGGTFILMIGYLLYSLLKVIIDVTLLLLGLCLILFVAFCVIFVFTIVPFLFFYALVVLGLPELGFVVGIMSLTLIILLAHGLIKRHSA